MKVLSGSGHYHEVVREESPPEGSMVLTNEGRVPSVRVAVMRCGAMFHTATAFTYDNKPVDCHPCKEH